MNIIKYSLLILTVIFPCYCYGELVTENNLTPDVIASTIKNGASITLFHVFPTAATSGTSLWSTSPVGIRNG